MGNYSDALTTLMLFLIFASIAHFNVVKAKPCYHHILVKTGDRPHAGTDAVVTLKLYDIDGNMIQSTNLEEDRSFLPPEWIADNYFERNQLDYFIIHNNECHTSKICNINLSHENTGPSPAWFVDYVTVQTRYHGDLFAWEHTKFEINQWLAKDSSLNVQKDICKVKNLDETLTCTHLIWIKTGNAPNAGTDARVTLKLYDAQGHMFEETDLKKSGGMGMVKIVTEASFFSAKSTTWRKYDYFETNHLDNVTMMHHCLPSKICKLKLSHDNSGNAPGWFVESIRVISGFYPSRYEGTFQDTTFEINQWLAMDEYPYSLSVQRDLCASSV